MTAFFRTTFALCGGFRVTGAQNVPKYGGVIFCPNHISDSDPGALYIALPRHDVYFMGKQELFRIPIMGSIFQYYGGFPVVRDSADRAALRLAEKILTTGRGLTIYPEGRISQSGGLQELQPGVAMLALRTGASIIPVGMGGTDKILPYGSVVPRWTGKPATVTFGTAIHMANFDNVNRRDAMAQIMERVRIELLSLTTTR
jgi:1-acyl-sn-glycerol-3-phosphate acyltransferase